MKSGHVQATSDVAQVVKARRGQFSLMGRYHCYPRKLESDYFVKDEVIGSGSSGKVLLAHSRTSPTDSFAVKRFHLSSVTASEREYFLSEAKIFLCMDHPHVARLVNVYDSPMRVDLVMERCSGGTLQERLNQGRLSESKASSATRQILLACCYLHAQGFAHRDLKLENCLYETPDSDHLKLIDFGLSKYLGKKASLRRMKTDCGTLYYVAPEVLNKAYTNKADCWSLGVIAFTLLSGRMPFRNSTFAETIRAIKGAKCHFRGDRWQGVSKQAKDFISLMLCKDSEKRPTAKEALSHPWIVAHYTCSSSPKLVQALPNLRSLSDFRKYCFTSMAWFLRAQDVHAVRQDFLAIDKDGGGTISFGELQQYFTESCCADEELVRQVFESLDINGDNEIDYSEFLALMMSSDIIEVSDSVIRTAFRNFDADLSGYITQGDLERLVPGKLDGSGVATLLQEANPKREGRVSFKDFRSFVRTTPGIIDDSVPMNHAASNKSAASTASSVASGIFYEDLDAIVRKATSLKNQVASVGNFGNLGISNAAHGGPQQQCCVCM